MSDQPLSPWVAAPGEDLCLDFANTRFWRGTESPTETIGGIDELLAWCEAKEGLPAAITAQWRARSAEAAAALGAALALRETIYRLFRALAAKTPPEEADLAALNRALAQIAARDALAPLGDGFGWRVDRTAPGAAGLLTPVLWSAGDLLTSRRLARLRHCANPQCLWLFIDDSKSGNRRWCSMSACGNRAKAHRHYVKRKGSG